MCLPGDSNPQDQNGAAAGMSRQNAGSVEQPCPYANNDHILYAVRATVTTRVGDIPLRNISVKLDGGEFGKTNAEGKSPLSSLRGAAKFTLEAVYENAGEKLKKETYSLTVTEVSAESSSGTPGKAKNFIAKVRDVLGSGSAALAGDKDFSDSYDTSISWEDHPDGKNKVIHVEIRMATVSLGVNYLNQNSGSETLTINAAGETHTFSGGILCMPTAITMLLDYWSVKINGAAITRKKFITHLWNKHSDPSVDFPCPWQIWYFVRDEVNKLLDDTLSASKTISGVATPPDYQNIPGDYADEIAKSISRGEPMAVSTLATGGHVILIRGAVVDHDERAQWLIFNDPYGNLNAEDSIYGRLDIGAPVGLRGTSTADEMNNPGDVEAVQAALKMLGKYNGPINGICDENDPEDATVKAIKKFQGSGGGGRVDPNGLTEKGINNKLAGYDNSSYSSKEKEKNAASGAGSDRGKHVYYNDETEGTGPGKKFRIRATDRLMVISRSPAYTAAEVSAKLVPAT